ncbi:uncharacterized protein [Rutidosis leptorrhynchoides]|uniref:uncharacterized protein n=1 Tax=Rutidosis leptorrhynchoides TaxID=125765 RepID=UPI003A991275
MLYGRKCRTPICWGEIGEKELGGSDLVLKTNEKIEVIRERLKATQDRQKSYVDRRRRPIEFKEGDMVMLKVSPWKDIIRFRKRGKLGPRYIGPFKILERVGEVAYRLELPEKLSGIHNTFHVSHIRKCLTAQSTIVPLKEVEVNDKLGYIEESVDIVDEQIRKIRNKPIKSFKVKWKYGKETEYTWETEEFMVKHFPSSHLAWITRTRSDLSREEL